MRLIFAEQGFSFFFGEHVRFCLGLVLCSTSDLVIILRESFEDIWLAGLLLMFELFSEAGWGSVSLLCSVLLSVLILFFSSSSMLVGSSCSGLMVWMMFFSILCLCSTAFS